MDREQRLNLYDAILKYAFDGEDTELPGVEEDIAFTVIKPILASNQRKAEGGKKGGRPKKTIGFETEETIGFEKTKPSNNKNNNKNNNNNKFCNIQQSDYDMKELERKVFIN